MIPEGSIRCNKCRTDMVVVDRNYVCACDIRRAHLAQALDEENRLRQAVLLLRGQQAICDRCKRADAWKLVQCSNGCSHAQCDGCAEYTRTEALSHLADR